MRRKTKIYFIGIFSLLSTNIFSQQAISFTESKKCDTTIQFIDSVRIERGKLRCIEDPGKQQVIYFIKKEEFQEYIHKHKISRSRCSDEPEMTFDFDKYDVVLIRINYSCFRNISFKTFEKKDCYLMNLNFFYKEYHVGDNDEGKVIECPAILNIYSRYFLLPKGKTKAPEFHVYETFYKCF